MGAELLNPDRSLSEDQASYNAQQAANTKAVINFLNPKVDTDISDINALIDRDHKTYTLGELGGLIDGGAQAPSSKETVTAPKKIGPQELSDAKTVLDNIAETISVHGLREGFLTVDDFNGFRNQMNSAISRGVRHKHRVEDMIGISVNAPLACFVANTSLEFNTPASIIFAAGFTGASKLLINMYRRRQANI